MGRSFARLAEWEITEVTMVALENAGDLDEDAIKDLVGGTLPAVEQLQNYIWRRHLASAIGRLLATSADNAVPMAIGFADIVGFTRRSREPVARRALPRWSRPSRPPPPRSSPTTAAG